MVAADDLWWQRDHPIHSGVADYTPPAGDVKPVGVEHSTRRLLRLDTALARRTDSARAKLDRGMGLVHQWCRSLFHLRFSPKSFAVSLCAGGDVSHGRCRICLEATELPTVPGVADGSDHPFGAGYGTCASTGFKERALMDMDSSRYIHDDEGRRTGLEHLVWLAALASKFDCLVAAAAGDIGRYPFGCLLKAATGMASTRFGHRIRR